MRTFLLILLAGILSWRFLPRLFRRAVRRDGADSTEPDPLSGQNIQDADFEEIDDSDKEKP